VKSARLIRKAAAVVAAAFIALGLVAGTAAAASADPADGAADFNVNGNSGDLQ
jgi:hypothetical protein